MFLDHFEQETSEQYVCLVHIMDTRPATYQFWGFYNLIGQGTSYTIQLTQLRKNSLFIPISFLAAFLTIYFKECSLLARRFCLTKTWKYFHQIIIRLYNYLQFEYFISHCLERQSMIRIHRIQSKTIICRLITELLQEKLYLKRK